MTEQQLLTLILNYGGLGLIAVIFCYVLRWNMKNYECLKKQHEKTVEDNTKFMIKVQTTMDNHIDHNTQALNDLCKAIKNMSSNN